MELGMVTQLVEMEYHVMMPAIKGKDIFDDIYDAFAVRPVKKNNDPFYCNWSCKMMKRFYSNNISTCLLWTEYN